VLVAGSTWPADEAVLLPALARWLRETPNARCLIAPHEPTAAHLAPVTRWAEAEGLPLRRLTDVEAARTDAHALDDSWRVLLVDRVGVLGDLYALATAAFVGGGFHAAGLHSVLEPAAFGVPVLFGPRHRNAREAGALLDRGAAVSVGDREALHWQLAHWSVDEAARGTAGEAARQFVLENRGSTARVVTLLEALLSRTPAHA
jgi:3-deoxy-D-manno-octulosonic-acid transferase